MTGLVTDSSPVEPPRRSRATRVAAIAVVAAILLLGGVAIGRVSAPAIPPIPSTTSAEAGFARDMQVHHQQGVQLALIVRDTSTDPAIRNLAYDIATAQAQQAGQMFGWLRVWGLPQASPEPQMTWMMRSESGDASAMPDMRMPGLATPEQIAALTSASGPPADRMFLELMMAHHAGAIEMAKALLDRSTHPIVAPFARGIIDAQQSEMTYMRDLLARMG